MRVTGTNLDAVQNAKILFKYPSENGALSNTTVQVRSSVLYHHIVIFHCLVIVISQPSSTLMRFRTKTRTFRCV